MASERPRRRKTKTRSERPTLNDVARAADVSPMTVSNVVNRRFELVRPETVERVQAAVRRLGYRPHLAGRALRLSVGWAIGMLVVRDDPDFLATPWMGRVVAGLTNRLHDNEYSLLLHNQGGKTVQEFDLNRFANTDALCVMLSGNDDHRGRILQQIMSLNRPVVALQEPGEPQHDDLAFVRQDDRGGGALLARHLYDIGARHLLFLTTGEPWPAMTERVIGIKGVGQQVGGLKLDVVSVDDGTYDVIKNVLRAYLANKPLPDALMAANEQIADTLLAVLQEMRIHVPEHVRVTAFNAFDLWKFSRVRITTIEVPAQYIGVRAADMLLDRLKNGRFERTVEVMPTRLLIGDTTARTASTKEGP